MLSKKSSFVILKGIQTLIKPHKINVSLDLNYPKRSRRVYYHFDQKTTFETVFLVKP